MAESRRLRHGSASRRKSRRLSDAKTLTNGVPRNSRLLCVAHACVYSLYAVEKLHEGRLGVCSEGLLMVVRQMPLGAFKIRLALFLYRPFSLSLSIRLSSSLPFYAGSLEGIYWTIFRFGFCVMLQGRLPRGIRVRGIVL